MYAVETPALSLPGIRRWRPSIERGRVLLCGPIFLSLWMLFYGESRSAQCLFVVGLVVLFQLVWISIRFYAAAAESKAHDWCPPW